MKPNKQQRKVLRDITSLLNKPDKQYLNVIGEGGTGKSWLISRIKEEFEEERPVIVTATTGLASANIEGRTIHSVLKLQLNMNEQAESIDNLHRLEVTERIELADDSILIIDESSMLDTGVFKLVSKLRNKLTITFGDKQQLPPVKALGYRPLGKTIELTEQMRQREGNLYNLISTYRSVKDKEHLDVLKYVNQKDVKLIHYDEMADHFNSNKEKNKKVISYTNDEADNIILQIQPTSKVYRLNNSITVYDGTGSEVYAVNGEEITVASYPSSWTAAQQYYKKKYGEKSKHRIRWDTSGYGLPVDNAIIKDIPALYVKLFTGRDSKRNEEIQRRFIPWLKERERLKEEYGERWKFHKDDDYINAARSLMAVESGVVSGRHACSLTVHKAQGQTINSVYINLDNIKRRDLMYVALSRAAKEIIFFSKDRVWNTQIS